MKEGIKMKEKKQKNFNNYLSCNNTNTAWSNNLFNNKQAKRKYYRNYKQ